MYIFYYIIIIFEAKVNIKLPSMIFLWYFHQDVDGGNMRSKHKNNTDTTNSELLDNPPTVIDIEAYIPHCSCRTGLWLCTVGISLSVNTCICSAAVILSRRNRRSSMRAREEAMVKPRFNELEKASTNPQKASPDNVWINEKHDETHADITSDSCNNLRKHIHYSIAFKINYQLQKCVTEKMTGTYRI